MKRDTTTMLNETASSMAEDQPDLRWTAHPASEQPARALMGLIWIMAFVFVVYATTSNIVWAVFSAMFLLAALHRFYYPTQFMIHDEGITARSLLRTRHMAWDRVKRFVHDQHGGVLFDRSQASRLDAYRGFHVIFSSNSNLAIEAIEKKIGRRPEHGTCQSCEANDEHGDGD